MNPFECIDAGTEFCPCYLAEVGECTVCTLLQGKEVCACNWSKVCIYQRYLRNGSKAVKRKQTVLCDIADSQRIEDGIYLKKIAVSRAMARSLNHPGSYVFVRGLTERSFFDAPMAIVASDIMEGTVTLAFHVTGPKTRLLERSPLRLFLRGPYWNGLQGNRAVESVRDARCLVVTGGMSQASVPLVIKRLLAHGNKVTLLVNTPGPFFISGYLPDDVIVRKGPLHGSQGQATMEQLPDKESIAFAFSAGSTPQHDLVTAFLERHCPGAGLAVSNNHTFCCGEGICGSCMVTMGDKSVRSCKVQFDPKQVAEEGAVCP
ncbi:sulfide/dihydroorotate dehydrogenase-like FAD/NAD-binding protein [Desulfoluna butyratoxydans]|uniref:2fe-2s ferredoxin-type iron-sulfur binding domain n=1 Tax=Desulfoluna butyratoxydans TaxID=231438 RepID=A0A4U8YP62_9BACT|nr:sulfide/dihydroorotate dehydrogenase-like FAD/NAD-binding protein [Desulfoluna butyratoxydans]VFQ45464.1 2fe-2s ferredoxin-type iron-sulfur binding domain [Desulfoluna butyratoxydans]